mgnify:CR=1 FL=1
MMWRQATREEIYAYYAEEFPRYFGDLPDFISATGPKQYAVAFRERDRAAWAFFQAQSRSYRRMAIGWILAAKREETRLRRLEQIVEASAAGRRWIQGAPRGMTR